MTHQPEELENTAVESSGVETPATRRVRPVLAFLAGLLEFGLGYVYVGRIRLTCAPSIESKKCMLSMLAFSRLQEYHSVSVVLWSLPPWRN
jgi:hypothetical protein